MQSNQSRVKLGELIEPQVLRLLDGLPDPVGVFRRDEDGEIRLGAVNRAAAVASGRTGDQLHGLTPAELFGAEGHEIVSRIERTVDRGECQQLETWHHAFTTGQRRFMFLDFFPIAEGCCCLFGKDLTDTIRLREEQLRLQKLDSLGVLAGGMAHDYNNLLTAILGNVELARVKQEMGRDSTGHLDKIEEAANRASALTKQLLTFSKGGAPVRTRVAARRLIREAVEYSLDNSAERCRLALPDDLWPCEVDAGQISQAIRSLLLNAHDAMADGGDILVSARNVTVADDRRGLPLEPGSYVAIAVTDSGPGIPRDLHQKIFDPYFSTRPAAQGLGLSTAYSIVRKHDGWIRVESEPGAGTTMTIYLPAAPEIVAEPAAAVTAAAARGRILVMDDEEMILAVTADLLDALGFDVATARHGEAACELYRHARDAGQPFDAVILDLVIPGGMGGTETIRVLRDLDPDVRGIVSSGYSNDPVMAEPDAYGFAAVMPKPYTLDLLKQTLGTLLAIDL